MNRLLVTSLIFVCSYSLAHEPYDARRDNLAIFLR